MTKKTIAIRLIIVLLALVIIASITYYATQKQAPLEETTFQPELVTVTETEVKTHNEFPATLEGEADIEVYPMVNGYLQKTYTDEGKYVEKGTLLFQIDDRIYRQQYNQAKAYYEASKATLYKADIELNNSIQLFENKIISDVQLAQIKAEHAAAKAAKEQAEASMQAAHEELRYTTIHAPVNGYLGRIPAKTGSRISSADTAPITTISQIDNIRAYFYLSEKDYWLLADKINSNQLPVELIVEGQQEEPYKGTIETTGGNFEKNEGRIMVRASIPNKAHLLRSGATGKIRIETFSGKAITIPKEATYRSLNQTIVYRLTPQGTLQTTSVQVKELDDTHYIVENGLHPNDKILFKGFDRVFNGMKITHQKN